MKKQSAKPGKQLSNTRKTIRKQKRLQKKAHRQEHYMKKRNDSKTLEYTPGKFVKRPADSPEREPKAKKKKNKILVTPQDILNKERQKDISQAEKLKSQMEEQRRKMMVQANDDEDKIIKKLEKQLGLNKCKNKKSFFADDGLDYLLEICDRATSEQIVAAEKHLANVDGESDFEDDLAVVTGKEISGNKQKLNKENESDNETANSDNELDAEDSYGDIDEEDMSVADSDNYEDDIEDIEEEGSNDEDEIFSSDDESAKSTNEEPEEKPSKSKTDKITTNKKQTNNVKKEKGHKEKVIKEDELSKVFSDDEISHLSGDDDDIEEFSGDESEKEVKSTEKPDVWEDIYGRKRDKEGNVIKEEKGIYIPPHLRNKDSSTEIQLAQLRRQIKSVLNKLAATNLHWACTSIENLYSSNSRNAVNTGLSRLWLDATVGAAHTPDRLVAEHAALVAVLHANVGTEIGAHFLQELTKRFDEMTQSPQPMGDKRLDNLVNCLAHLYNFKIYHGSLLYDIFGRLLDELTEKNIECVLVALRSVGGVLRKEEPLALKNFIHDTQARVAKLNEAAADGSRIKFLLEVLMAVKNNNLTKIPNYNPGYAEQLKVQTRSVIRKGNYVTPLNIRLEDLLKADERGKWWVVGSAWEGTRRDGTTTTTTIATGSKVPGSHDQQLLELARKQRMNTDVRRSVFCVIMSAQDYMDAFEKLQHLGLKGQQEREIVHVMLACCLQEKKYNPYYAVLGQKFCDTDRKYQLAIQYSAWDKIKDLENLPRYSAVNLAQFLVHLILAKGLPLSVLKVIEFSDLNKHSVRFMRQILLAIILNSDLQETLEVFHRVSKPPKLHVFRESVRLFIQHFLLKNAGKSNVLNEEEMAVLRERVVEVDKILMMYESKMKF